MLVRIRTFYDNFVSVGDRLGEAFYGVWMATVSIGLLNSVGEITPDHINWVISVAFVVNLGWGIIDGVTVMLTNMIERTKRDGLVHDLQIEGEGGAATKRAFTSLEGTIAVALDPVEKRKIIEAIARGDPGHDPGTRPQRPTVDDWWFALSIAAVDVLVLVPIVLPLALIPDVNLAVQISRLAATLLFALLGAAYAKNLNRNPWIGALLVGALGFCLFALAYEAGW